MSSNQKTRSKVTLEELAKCKSMLVASELENKTLSKDYINLVKKYNVVVNENSLLRLENLKLRERLNERRKNCDQVDS